jgi:hypothetical protein
VLYVALEEVTALAEVAWHRARFMREWSLPRQTTDYQVLGLSFTGTVEDVRPCREAGIYAPESWAEGQVLGARIRAGGIDAIAYASVRHLGGECLAGFRPKAFSQCRCLRYTQFFWDGKALQAPGLPIF